MIQELIENHLEVVKTTFDSNFILKIEEAASTVSLSLKSGGNLIFCGNGGSAADSQHISAEFVSKLKIDRDPLAAVALTVDTSAITAIGNDYGFENIFSRQLEAIGRHEDTLIALTTSGRSQNVIKAVHSAHKMGLNIIVLTGANGIDSCADADFIELRVASHETARIQEVHIMIGHILCAVSEKDYI